MRAIETAIREPGVEGTRQFARRVHLLALIYPTLFLGALVGIGLIVWQAKFLVTLTQRSNVETLTLAFFVVFFGYIATLSAVGLPGAARVGYYALLRLLGHDHLEIERRKQRAITKPMGEAPVVALNVVLERQGSPGETFHIEVRDAAGSLGSIAVDGARVTHRDCFGDGSNDLLAYFVRQLNQILGQRVGPAPLDIVNWKSIDDEATEQYLGLVGFARRLERHLDAPQLWRKVELTDDDCEEVKRRLSAICAALRDEAFLPDWEYAGEHKLPIIPEPLGLVSLTRSERRVDPVASMGCAVFVILATIGVLVLFIAFPPWVPGT